MLELVSAKHENYLHFLKNEILDLIKNGESDGKSSVKGDIHRKEKWEFPVSVIREAIVNMIVHRDYRQNIKSTI